MVGWVVRRVGKEEKGGEVVTVEERIEKGKEGGRYEEGGRSGG